VASFVTRHDIDLSAIQYKDKNSAKQHQEHIKKRQEKFAEK